MENKNNFAVRLLECRKAARMSQKALANVLGISDAAITMMEKGKRSPSFEVLCALADFFDVSIDYLTGNSDVEKDPPNIIPVGNLVSLPVIASVRAGYGGAAVELWEDDKETIPLSMLRGYPPEECRLFRVKGDSMYPRIIDGDLIVVHMQASVDSGDIAVIIYNGDEATIKRVIYVPGEDWMELIPTNPEYPVKRVEGADLEECRVYGKVIGLWGNL